MSPLPLPPRSWPLPRSPACTPSAIRFPRALGFSLAAMLITSGSAAQEPAFPDFDLRIDAPGVVAGDPGETLGFDAEVVLSTRENPGDRGAQGWSLSIAATGVTEIVDVTTEGTAGAPIPDGFLRGGLTAFEITTGEGNEGAVAAVVLGVLQPSSLPPEGEEKLLRLRVEARVPEEGCAEAGLEFRDGLQGSGAPVANTIAYDTGTQVAARRDDGGSSDNDQDDAQSASVPVCVAGGFRRGDCDGVGSINLTDAIFGLQFLFQASVQPLCLKACDADDDGGVTLTDAIFLLNHIFLGQAPPPAPFPDCGLDTTDDTLPCAEQAACR